MITHGLFLLIVAVALFLLRQKIAWGGVLLGIFVAFLLLSTPIGTTLQDGADALAASLRAAGNGLVDAVRGAVG